MRAIKLLCCGQEMSKNGTVAVCAICGRVKLLSKAEAFEPVGGYGTVIGQCSVVDAESGLPCGAYVAELSDQGVLPFVSGLGWCWLHGWVRVR